MPVLEGIGDSTQLGDTSALFLAVAALVGLARRRGQAGLLFAAARAREDEVGNETGGMP